jgi:hypothetical protein
MFCIHQLLAFEHLFSTLQAGELLKEDDNSNIQPGWVTTMCVIVTGSMLPRRLLYSRDTAAAMEYLHEQHGASMCFKAAFWLLFAFEATWADVRPSMHMCFIAQTYSNECRLHCSYHKGFFSLTKVFWHAQSPKLQVTVQSLFHSASVYCSV